MTAHRGSSSHDSPGHGPTRLLRIFHQPLFILRWQPATTRHPARRGLPSASQQRSGRLGTHTDPAQPAAADRWRKRTRARCAKRPRALRQKCRCTARGGQHPEDHHRTLRARYRRYRQTGDHRAQRPQLRAHPPQCETRRCLHPPRTPQGPHRQKRQRHRPRTRPRCRR